jgi:hypothetical protein
MSQFFLYDMCHNTILVIPELKKNNRKDCGQIKNEPEQILQFFPKPVKTS